MRVGPFRTAKHVTSGRFRLVVDCGSWFKGYPVDPTHGVGLVQLGLVGVSPLVGRTSVQICVCHCGTRPPDTPRPYGWLRSPSRLTD